MPETTLPMPGQVFRAVADPTRRGLLDLLRQGERSVTDLMGPFVITQPAMSQHLRVLREAGLVRHRRQGRQRIYSVDAEPLHEVFDWVARYETFWRRRLQALAEYLDHNEVFG